MLIKYYLSEQVFEASRSFIGNSRMEFRVCKAPLDLKLKENSRLREKGQPFPQASESRGRKGRRASQGQSHPEKEGAQSLRPQRTELGSGLGLLRPTLVKTAVLCSLYKERKARPEPQTPGLCSHPPSHPRHLMVGASVCKSRHPLTILHRFIPH